MYTLRYIKNTLLALALLVSAQSSAQVVDSLVGMVNGELIKIHQQDAGINSYITISGFPTTYNPFRLTWCEPSNCYYGLSRPVTGDYTTYLFRISASGVYEDIGEITVPGETVFMCEGLGFNRFDGDLYASASFNGGPSSSPADYWSEVLIRLDTVTTEGEYVGTFSHASIYEPEADKIAFDDAGMLYYEDGQPGAGGFERIFEQVADFSSSSDLIYESTSGYYPTSDLTVENDTLYFSSDRNLRQIDLTTDTYSVIGDMFTAGDFDGELLRGLTWRFSCTNDPAFEYSKDTWCLTEAAELPTSITMSGGTFTVSPLGLTIDPLSGEIDPSTSTPGTYDITYTLPGSSSCDNDSVLTITIADLPTVDPLPDLNLCENETVATISFTGSSGATFDWTNDNTLIGLSASGSGDIASFTAATSGGIETATITVTPTAGSCVGTPESFIITVIPATVVDAGADQTICQGEEVTLSGSGTGLTSSSWDLGVVDGVPFSPGATATYTFTGTDASGCPGTDEVIVTIIPIPDISAGPDVTSCDGDLITLTTSNPDGASLSWNLGISEGVPFGQAVGTTTYIVTGDLSGCISTDTIDVTVHPLPVFDFTIVTQGECDPLTAEFTVTGGVTSSACYWEFGDGSISTDCNPTHVFNNAGSFDVSITLTDLNGCSATVEQPDAVVVSEKPNAEFSFSPNTISNLESTVNFYNASSNANSFEWDFGDASPISNEENPTHTFKPGDNFTIELVAWNDEMTCSDTTTKIIFYQEEIIFYVPNVFTPDGDSHNENFTPVFSSGVDPYDYHLTIFNRWGEIVFESYNLSKGWDGTYGSLGIVQDGVYIWQIEFGDNIHFSDKRYTYRGHVTILK